MFKTPVPETKQIVRWLASDLITFLKNYHTYCYLSRMTNIPITLLNRYAKKTVTPTYERAIEIYKKLEPLLATHLKKILNGDDWSALYSPSTLNILSTIITFKVAGNRVTKILAFDDIAPVAIATSLKLGTPYIIIVQSRNMIYKDWTTIEIRVGDTWIYYHLPAYLLSKNDSILYIDAYMTPIKEEVLNQLQRQKHIKIEKTIVLKKLIDTLDVVS